MKEANVGSEAAKRAVETIKGLSQYLSTQILLARDDVFMAMIAAMNAAPPEASAALSIYCGLSEMETGQVPPYLGSMSRPEALQTLKILKETQKLSQSDREKAGKLLEHLEKAAPSLKQGIKEDE